MVQSMGEMNTACFAHDAEMITSFGLVTMAYENVMKMHKTIIQDTTVVGALTDFLQTFVQFYRILSCDW